MVCTSGYRRLTSRIASMVSIASRRVSSCPVAIGNVRQSTMMSHARIPQLPVRSSISRVATATFHSAVRAWPCSSMVSAITAAPCSLTSGIIRAMRDAGPVAVLVVHRVDHGAAAEQLQAGLDHLGLGGVEHQRQRRRGGQPPGDLASCRRRRPGPRSPRRRRAGARRPWSARGRSRRSRRSARRPSPRGTPSSRWRWCARRSPGTPCPGGTARAGRARRRRARAGPRAAASGRPRTRSTTLARCSGVVPQQPPTRASPNSRGEALVRVGQLPGVSG